MRCSSGERMERLASMAFLPSSVGSLDMMAVVADKVAREADGWKRVECSDERMKRSAKAQQTTLKYR